ncbi:MAG TPA: ABC transporter permease, partial [Candidatus Paenibacillus intestinavium]|nr:ABC transporter permease [Candidatus Paenibacillus intestinavium]
GEHGLVLFWRHGLRNVALPAITLQFAAFSELFGGAVLAEQVFSYPGLGQATVEAGLRGDVPLLLGIVIFSTLFVFVGNLLADISYHILDPRTREGRKV